MYKHTHTHILYILYIYVYSHKMKMYFYSFFRVNFVRASNESLLRSSWPQNSRYCSLARSQTFGGTYWRTYYRSLSRASGGHLSWNLRPTGSLKGSGLVWIIEKRRGRDDRKREERQRYKVVISGLSDNFPSSFSGYCIIVTSLLII